MPKITFIGSDGLPYDMDAVEGESLMQAAVNNFVPGILGDCGGCCSCATCHAYVEPEWMARLPPKSDDEAFLLEGVAEANEHSRLCCQLAARGEWDGLVLKVPALQS